MFLPRALTFFCAPHLTSRASTLLPGPAQGSATGAMFAARSPERDTFSGSQARFQGVLGSCLVGIAYGIAVARLGAGRAALFPALVPAAELSPVLAVLPHFAWKR